MNCKHLVTVTLTFSLAVCQTLASAQTIRWEQTNGPFGGNVAALAVAQNGDLFAGTAFGVFRSTDNGNGWQNVYAGSEGSRITSLTILPNDDILAATFGSGIIVSRDNGNRWQSLNEGLASPNVLALASNETGDAFAGTQSDGIFRLSQNSASWQKASQGLDDPFVRSLAVRSNGDLFAGTFKSGVFFSSNAGQSWRPLSAGLTEGNVSSLAVSGDDEVLAGTFGAGVFLLDEVSEQWQALGAVSQNGAILGLVSTRDGAIFAGTMEGVIRAARPGAPWRIINSGLRARNVLALAVNPGQELFAGAQLGGVFRSSNSGDNWTEVNNGLTNTDVITITGNQEGDIFAGTFVNGVFRSSDNGDNWEPVNEGLACACALSLSSSPDGMLFVATTEGVFRSVDKGDTWTPVNNGLGGPGDATDRSADAKQMSFLESTLYAPAQGRASWLRQVAFQSTSGVIELIMSGQGTLFAGTFGRGIFRSLNNGDDWQAFNQGLDNKFVTAVSVSGVDQLFTGTLAGVFHFLNAERWTLFNSGITNSNINDFTFTPGGTAFVATNGGGVARLAPGSTTWEPVNLGLESLFVNYLAHTEGGDLLAGTDGAGFFLSRDQGDHWQAENEGLTNLQVLSLYVNPNGDFFAGTYGSGVFRSREAITAVDVRQVSPTRFALGQNFPNPFNPETRIEFTIPAAAQVTLKVYNLLGQEVRTLVDGPLAAGSRSIVWDGRNHLGADVGSGLYVYRINVTPGSPDSLPFQQDRKMLLVR